MTITSPLELSVSNRGVQRDARKRSISFNSYLQKQLTIGSFGSTVVKGYALYRRNAFLGGGCPDRNCLFLHMPAVLKYACEEIDCKERLRHDIFSVLWDVIH